MRNSGDFHQLIIVIIEPKIDPYPFSIIFPLLGLASLVPNIIFETRTCTCGISNDNLTDIPTDIAGKGLNLHAQNAIDCACEAGSFDCEAQCA